mmetsp:Transcript_5014/g.21518  ORF Transcript_5014/g.21518 Transcript_5014/m.21518 type:complete len:296 (+) Transcript_5014:499-1386(+)
MATLSATLMPTISCSFTVRSSSFDPPPASMATEGRMQSGGTARWVRMRLSGRPTRESTQSRSLSASGTARSSRRQRTGVSTSAAPSSVWAFTSGLRRAASATLARRASVCASPSLWTSCTMRNEGAPGTRFTWALELLQKGQMRVFLQAAMMSFRSFTLRSASVPGARMRLSMRDRIGSLSSTRLQVLQMHCIVAMVALKNPMWNTGSASSMWPNLPTGSISFAAPSLGSRTPQRTGVRCGSEYSCRETTGRCDACTISLPDMSPKRIVDTACGRSHSLTAALTRKSWTSWRPPK